MMQKFMLHIIINRRLFTSTAKAMQIIEEDGGVKSFNFELTDWAHTIELLPTPAPIKDAWVLANSTHVLYLAFFLGGEPTERTGFVDGNLS